MGQFKDALCVVALQTHLTTQKSEACELEIYWTYTSLNEVPVHGIGNKRWPDWVSFIGGAQ